MTSWNWSVILTVKAQIISADMSKFSIQDSLAKALLEKNGIVCIHKTTRAGATISIVNACCQSEKKVTVIVPTIKIIKEIETKIPELSQIKPRIAPILSNPELCKKLNPTLRMKFQFRPSCRGCEFKSPNDCTLQRILNEDFDIYALTYDKLRALQISRSLESRRLLKKLAGCDVFVLDEFSTAVLISIPTTTIMGANRNGRNGKLQRELPRLREESEKLENPFVSIFWDIIDDFLSQFEKVEKSITYTNDWVKTLSEREVRVFLAESWHLIEQITETGIDTTLLQDVTLAASSKEIIATFEEGGVKITPKLEDALKYVREFCEDKDSDQTILLVDSYQPTLNFSKVFAKNVEHITWGQAGDPLNTNATQLVVCDTAHWGSVNFFRDKYVGDRVRSFLNSLASTFLAKNMLVVTTNIKMAKMIASWNLPVGLKITWFRSDLMRGVQAENRNVMVCIGGPYVPKNAYVPESQSFDFEDLVEKAASMTDGEKAMKISSLLKLDDTCSEFVNSIGRVKDPQGEQRSVVFTLGMTSVDVMAMLRQNKAFGVSIPHVVRPHSGGGFMRDSVSIAKIWLAEIKEDDVSKLRYLYQSAVDFLPVLGRIIRMTKEKNQIRASEVIHRNTELTLQVARKHIIILKYFGVEIDERQGGITFKTESNA